MSDYEFVNVNEHNDKVIGHAFVWRNIHMIANDQGQVAIYRKHYPQGNTNPSVTKSMLDRGFVPGGTKIISVPLLLMPDSPSRYT